jgi:hypothetical protein
MITEGMTKMKSNQDGTGTAPYAAETAREILELGPGGHGNFESLQEGMERGVTPGLVATTKNRALEENDVGAEPKALKTNEQPLVDQGHGDNEHHDLTQRIREKAYELWTLEGCPDGRHLDHWEMAKDFVAQDEGSRRILNSQKLQRSEV